MSGASLELQRGQVLAFRRRASALDTRLPAGAASLRRAAWAGLQDSVPRAALLSLRARVEGIEPSTWEDPALVQVWGPRFAAYVVPAQDHALFTLSRMPESGSRRTFGMEIAERLDRFLEGRRMSYSEAGHAMGVNPNALRYGTLTGRLLIRWEGARRPLVWTVPQPQVSAHDARLEAARRYLRVFGPTSADSFAAWLGVKPPVGRATFNELEPSLVPVKTPIGDAWIRAEDEAALRASAEPPPAPARLLPSGDPFFLLWAKDRQLLVPDAARRAELWTSRVWPGALLIDGEPVGTWRRDNAVLDISTWRTLSPAERGAVEAEAASLPLPGLEGRIVVRWLR